MSKDDALKLAIKVLRMDDRQRHNIEKTIKACKEALKQPTQERAGFFGRSKRIEECAKEWQGLSDWERADIFFISTKGNDDMLVYAKAIEQKLKEKNT